MFKLSKTEIERNTYWSQILYKNTKDQIKYYEEDTGKERRLKKQVPKYCINVQKNLVFV